MAWALAALAASAAAAAVASAVSARELAAAAEDEMGAVCRLRLRRLSSLSGVWRGGGGGEAGLARGGRGAAERGRRMVARAPSESIGRECVQTGDGARGSDGRRLGANEKKCRACVQILWGVQTPWRERVIDIS